MKNILFCCVFAASALAQAQTQPMVASEYQAAKSRIEADHTAAEGRCGAMQANAKDICEKEADGQSKVARAELEQRYKPSASNARKVTEVKIKAEYAIANEKCEDLKADAKKSCEKESKAKRDRSNADLKSSKT